MTFDSSREDAICFAMQQIRLQRTAIDLIGRSGMSFSASRPMSLRFPPEGGLSFIVGPLVHYPSGAGRVFTLEVDQNQLVIDPTLISTIAVQLVDGLFALEAP